MKTIAALAFVVFSLPAFAKVFFHALTDASSTHELTWNFSEPVKDWGSKDPSQVILDCEGVTLEKPSKILWSNSQTLKLVPFRNFLPGSKCVARLNLPNKKQKDEFNVPLIQILEQRPYNLHQLTEDTTFVLVLDSAIDDELIAEIAYVEVEGLREKIEFDAITGDLKQEVLRNSFTSDGAYAVVLKPRRVFPFNKRIVLKVPQKYTYAFELRGQIRENFQALMRCERPNAESLCSPLSKVRIDFNEEVKTLELKRFRLHQGKRSWGLTIPESDSTTSAEFVAELEPDKEYQITIDGDLKDLDHRPLSNAHKFPLDFKTGAHPPLAKFPGSFGILEANIDPMLPVSVRNIERTIRFKKNSAVLSLNHPKIFVQWLEAIDKRQDVGYAEMELRAKSLFEGSALPFVEEKIDHEAKKNEVEVLGLPLKKKGLHLVELASPRLAKSLLKDKDNFFISTAVLVTNLSAHLKVGKNDSLVWVTSLDRAEAVSGVEVILYDCKGNVLDQGITGTKGYVAFSKASASNLECTGGFSKLNYSILAVAKKDDDATFTLSRWDEGIESWRFGTPYYNNSHQENVAHTVFDRPIYKVKEKVHMLHLLRSQGNEGLVYSETKYSHALVQQIESQKEWLIPLKWNDFGSSSAEFSIPENSPQGMYHVSLVVLNDKKQATKNLSSGLFIVKDYRVPLMRSEVHFLDKKEHFRTDETIKLLGHLEYLAGGNSSATPVTLRGELTPLDGADLKAWPAYQFSFTPVKSDEVQETKILEKKLVRTDENGDFSFDLTDIPKSTKVMNFMAEIEYLDPNGVYQTNSTQTKIYPFDKLIGIKSPDQVKTAKASRFHVVVLDLEQRPLKNVRFQGTLYKQSYISTRKKIIGGFYAYDSSYKLEKIGEFCDGKTNSKGEARCEIKFNDPGTYILQLNAGEATGKTNVYVYGKDYAWAPQEYNDRVDLVPNEKLYRPGDTAKVTMNLPFEKATVLVTKERGGIKEVFLTPYDRTNPFLMIPIEKTDFPNFYLSALAVRGRISSPAATGMVDLGKPAYKMGLQEIKVDRMDHNLKITLQTEKEKYQVRDRVRLKVKVTSMDGSPVAAAKVAVSVFDEGLLLLNGQNSFDAAKALVQPFSHGVQTATAQSHVIGKRHFGLKARAHGGGGGKDLKPRELFETLIYWNPSVTLDKNGEATLEFKLNDALTSFKIYGLAYSREKFGTSNSRVIATQDIMTFIGTSPEIRTGDEFSASYTLKNISSEDKRLRAELFLNEKKIKEETLDLKATESYAFNVPVSPFETKGIATYLLNLYAGSKKIDSIKTTQRISPLEVPRVRYSDLKELSSPVTLRGMAQEKRLHGTEIVFTSALTPSLKSLQDFMSTYPYSCLEQKLARAIIMDDQKLLGQIDRDLSSYVDDRGLLKFYPTQDAKGSVELTSYFLEMNFWNRKKSSQEDQLKTALAAFINGRGVRLQEWEKKEFPALKTKAMVALKIVDDKFFVPQWLSDIASPAPEDSLMDLLNKWVLFSPGEKSQKAFALIQTKMKIDGSSVTLLAERRRSFEFLHDLDATVFGRLLLLQSSVPTTGDFAKFYQDNEGKFIRGYFSHRRDGHFGGTTANTYAFLLHKKWAPRSPATGKVSVANLTAEWKNGEAPTVFLDEKSSVKDQTMTHTGTGKPWADIRTLIFPDKNSGESQGIRITSEVSNLENHSAHQVQDRVQVRLSIEVKNDLTMGAINLPLPSGVTVLEASTNLSLDFEERTESKWRGYFNAIPKGKYFIDVIFRLNQAGTYEVPGARMEAMYSPDVFGESAFWKIKVK